MDKLVERNSPSKAGLQRQVTASGRVDELAHGSNPVEVPEGHHQLPDDGVETGAEPPARDDCSPGSRRVEEDSVARAGSMVGGGVEGRREIYEDVSEDDVVLGDVEAVGRVVEWVAV
jgi:hypothetical protein